MMQQSVTVASSLEARTAALFVQNASKYSSSIKVSLDSKSVNAKSIMGIISLGIMEGQILAIEAEGEDEDQAVAELVRFLNKAQ